MFGRWFWCASLMAGCSVDIPEATCEQTEKGCPATVYFAIDGVPPQWMRVTVEPGAQPEAISATLDERAGSAEPGRDTDLAVSPDGSRLTLVTDRYDDCKEAEGVCLVTLDRALTTPEIVEIDGEIVRRPGVLTNDGRRLVLVVDRDGRMDLAVSTRSGTRFAAPVLLTGESPYFFHGQPALSPDETRVVFSCADEQYFSDPGAQVCEIGLDGSGFRIVLDPAKFQPGEFQLARSPHYAADGSIVFGARVDGAGEIWRLPPDGDPVRISRQLRSDLEACPLPDGRIASISAAGDELALQIVDPVANVVDLRPGAGLRFVEAPLQCAP